MKICDSCGDIMTLEREIDNLRHEVVQYQAAFKAADFRATDYSQRIIKAAAVMNDLGVHGDVRVHLNAALKLGDD